MTLQWQNEQQLKRVLLLLGVTRFRVTQLSANYLLIEMPRDTSADVRWKIREHGPTLVMTDFAELPWWSCWLRRRQWRQA